MFGDLALGQSRLKAFQQVVTQGHHVLFVPSLHKVRWLGLSSHKHNLHLQHKQSRTDLRENNACHIADGPAVLTDIRAEAVHTEIDLPQYRARQDLELLWTRRRAKNRLQLHHQIWWKPDGAYIKTPTKSCRFRI